MDFGRPSRRYRRSNSFEILANNSSGDGDSVITAVEGVNGTIGVEKGAEAKTRRRRRKSRSRKMSLGDLSPLSPLDEDLSSLPGSPLGLLLGSSRMPPLDASNSWQNGDSSAEPSPSLSAFSPMSWPAAGHSRASSGGGPSSQGDFRASGNPSFEEVLFDRIEEPRSARDARLLPGDSQNFSLESEERSTHSTQAAHKLYSDPDILRQAVEFPDQIESVSVSMVSSAEKLQLEGGSAERVLKPRQLLPPKPPDFSAASEGLAEPVFAPGTLHPRTELRQRVVEKTSDRESENEKSRSSVANGERNQRSRPESNPSTSADEHQTPPAYKVRLGTFSTPQMKDWERLMATHAQNPPPLELSPMQYLVTEIFSGSTLRNTTSVGTEQKRERVYNTMFHVPWRCELLIDVGFIVCLDAFLSLFTVMPARIVMFAWQRLARLFKVRQLQRPFAAELCDLGCLVVVVVGVAILMQADISIIYHWIRGQGIIKLYVVFNVLEIFDKLCQSFGVDVLQVLFNSAVNVECCRSENLSKEMVRFAFDQCIAVVSFFAHSLVIISQAITISAAVNAQNNALLTLLISNNFAEIKSNVFKRMGTDQLHKMAYSDTVERFHIMTHVLFVWAQNVLNGENSLWLKLFYNAGMVFICEVMVDVIKHSFLAKFNEVKPAAYSEFLQALCSQTLNSQSHEVHKTLSFVPLAPACVVIRILLPVYASCVPEGPMWWRWPCMLLLGGLTYIVLVIFKVVVGLGLQYHAKWYLKRHPWTAPHPHFE